MTRAIVLVLAVAGSVAAFTSDTPPVLDVAALVRQLGSEDFAERESAEKQLAALKVKEVPPELLAALKSPKAEVRERAARIVATIRKRLELVPLPRGQRFAKNGQIDLYVASTAATDPKLKADDDSLWLPADGIARKVVDNAGLKGNRKPQGTAVWFDDYATFRQKHQGLRFFRYSEHYTPPDGYVRSYHRMLQSEGITESEPLCGVFTSRGSVSTKQNVYQAIVFATGDVDAGDILSSIVICDGDIRAAGQVSRSVLIARGSISIKGNAESSTFSAGGSAKAKSVPPPPVLLPGDDPMTVQRNRLALAMYDEFGVKVHEKQTNPLGFITFFELHRVGLEVKAADKAVTVAKIDPSSASEKAGLKVGDVVLDVGGKVPTDAEALRRLLRNALAVGDAAVKVRRGTDALTLKVALPE